MKGIILAGGSGTRLYPSTLAISKQILPIYDKPMIYYPLSVLMLAGVKEVMIISTPNDLPHFQRLLEDGSKIGMQFTYAVQERPEGIAQAFIIAEEFIGKDSVCLILGDNIFYGHKLGTLVEQASLRKEGATVFGYYVDKPEQYGVASFDKDGVIIDIEEKPKYPKSNYAITGLYVYDNKVVEYAKKLKPSARGELEITDINRMYVQEKQLKLEVLGRGMAWLDTGTHSNLLEASNFVSILEKRQGLKIACIEEIAFRKGFIDKEQLLKHAKEFQKNHYGEYLASLVKE